MENTQENKSSLSGCLLIAILLVALVILAAPKLLASLSATYIANQPAEAVEEVVAMFDPNNGELTVKQSQVSVSLTNSMNDEGDCKISAWMTIGNHAYRKNSAEEGPCTPQMIWSVWQTVKQELLRLLSKGEIEEGRAQLFDTEAAIRNYLRMNQP